MTGELTLRGTVAPVGGIKEKLLGAHRDGIRKVILPQRNRKDVEFAFEREEGESGSAEIRRDLELVFVSTVAEALEAAFGEGIIKWRREGQTAAVGVADGGKVQNVIGVESRL